MDQSQKTPTSARFARLVPVITFLSLCVIGYLVFLLFPNSIPYLGCNRSNLIQGRVHTLATYAFLHFSIGHLFGVTVSLLLSMLFLADKLPQKRIWQLIFGSSVLGAVLFCVFEKRSGILAGGVMITWGFAGAVMATGFAHWGTLNLLRRIYCVLIVIYTIGMSLHFNAVSWAQLVVTIGGFIVGRASRSFCQATAVGSISG